MSRDAITTAEVPPAFRERQAAVVQVFQVLSARWPRFFAASRSAELLPVWIAAVTTVETAALVPAATDYAAHHSGKFAPEPAEFAAHARAYLRRVTGQDRVAPAANGPDDPYVGARPFWYEKPGPEKGPYRLDAAHAVAFAVTQGPLAGGSLGISDLELDRIARRELASGWLAPEAVPAWAAPTSLLSRSA